MSRNKIDDKSFGYRHLCERGWNDGEGLGRDNNGAADPIKVNLKHDKAGLGHDISKNFTNQWWDHVFNKAAAKLSVETDEEGVKVTSNSDLSEKQKEKLKRKVLYGNFVKGSTLEFGQETHEVQEAPEEECLPSAVSVLTDDQLLLACGGRTAHKGARHGFKMNGKLARLEQQDSSGFIGDEELVVRHKTKKSKKSKDTDNVEARLSDEPSETKAKKKKHKHKRVKDSSYEKSEEVEEIKPKKKRRKDR